MGSRIFWGLVWGWLIGVFIWSVWFIRLPTPDQILAAQIGKRVTLEGVIVRAPDVRDTEVNLDVRINNTTLLVHAPAHAMVSYGDRVLITGTLKAPRTFQTDTGRAFNYPAFLAVRGISLEMTRARVQYRSGPSIWRVPVRWAINVRQIFLYGLKQTLPSPEDGVAAGITIGARRSIGPKLTHELEQTGLIHIVTLSGYNITVILRNIRAFLDGAPTIAANTCSFAIIIFLMIISGGSASAVRSCIMALIALYARSTRRAFNALRAAGLVAVLMVVWNPYLLVFDPGFELSTIGTIGLILFTPVFERYLRFVTSRFGLREIVASTLATQIAVSPFLWYTDGYVSAASLPANVCVLIILPAAMFCSLVASIAGVLFGSHGIVFAFPAHVLIKYIITVADFFAYKTAL